MRSYEGKIVRKINIETLDPFGFSEKDTTKKPVNYVQRAGNSLHLKSKNLTIHNLLLIKRNKPLDSLLVKESERLVRGQRYVRSVLITPQLIKGNPDSVDVTVRVLDAWSLVPDAAFSGNRGNIALSERNFFGLGHRFDNSYQREFATGHDAYSTRYIIPNIMNTYINTAFAYQINLDDHYTKSISVDRPFFSPFAKWAAGAYLDQQFRWDTLPDANLEYSRQNFKFNTTDFWGGYSYQLLHGNTENERTTNVILTARYLNVNYLEAPAVAYDTVHFYADERFYLVGMGISSRQFVEDKYIFDYGLIEDVPVGRTAGLTGGWQEKNGRGRLYTGARVSYGNYFKGGYLSTNAEYGTFWRNGTNEQSALTFQANYFTNLLESGKWKFRQFVKARTVLGTNRVDSRGDMLTLNENGGLPGFDTDLLYGSKKLLLTFQTQAYAPWNFAGFRLNPYFNYSVGMLGVSGHGFLNSKAYSAIGLGFIISNDYLVFSTFQLSLAYYPTMPGNGQNIFQTNAFSTADFGFQGFELAKPRTVDYQ
ncbi:MAG: hypothetical protein EOO51_05840 [Flavobacterium sp.]|nr:MAG: hypothetical protein EOO51_05840 [Flavobacterium sp.]